MSELVTTDQLSFVNTTWSRVEPGFFGDVIVYQVTVAGQVAVTLNTTDFTVATNDMVGETVEVVAINVCRQRSNATSAMISRGKISVNLRTQ